MQSIFSHRTVRISQLSACTALAAALFVSAGAFAAPAPVAPPATPASQDNTPTGVADIVVTAQKRSQNLQDVPISMTAVTPRLIEANRITSVTDLATAVPNLAARSATGGSQLPSFTMRGITSYGVVPGSDKELSLYLDGVYIGSTVGSQLDLPELERIEVLRGPQGTLFGRNATVGAISIITRNPPDKFGVDQEFSVGNYSEFRSKTRIDTGDFGNFSASISYLHDESRGDIRNLGAGTVIKFPASAGVPTTQVSPQYLGSKNENIVFAALKYESGDLKITDKFDWTGNHYTPVGAAPVGIYAAALGPGAFLLNTVLATQPTQPVLVTNGQRPKAVNNSFTLPAYARDWGDSLTAEYRATDHLSFKNIAAYRKSYLRANDDFSGLGGLTVTAATSAALGSIIPSFGAANIGSPFQVLGIEQVTTSEQYSEEFQANYNSRFLTVTAGALYFHLKGESGGPPGIPNNVTLSVLAGGLVSGDPARAFNKAESIAGYIQAEAHVTSELSLVGGFRETHDKKSGTFDGALPVAPFTYHSTQPSFSGGVNYKPTRDILLYGKYSTAFVSGGQVGTVPFKPEKARSAEIGVKSDLFDRHLRANLALFDVHYSDLQSAQSGITIGHPELALAVADQGDAHARGFEFESTIVPVKGVTFGAAAGYTDIKFTRLDPTFATEAAQLGVPLTLNNFLPVLQPKWTFNLSAEYITPPLSGDARMSFRIDASGRSKERVDAYTVLAALPQYSSLTYSPSTWILNARASLYDIQLPIGRGSIAVWAKNLTDAKQITFADILGGFEAATEFQPARTYGLDITFHY